MTETQTDLLREVGNGRHGFQPDDRSDVAVARFARVVDDLEAVESIGYIEIFNRHWESWSGQGNLDHVSVRLTEDGQEWLKENPDNEAAS